MKKILILLISLGVISVSETVKRDGIIETFNTINGVKEGSATIEDDNGIMYFNYNHGVGQGIVKIYKNDGIKLYSTLKNGKMEGSTRIEYPNGDIVEATSVNDKLNGKATRSEEDGIIYFTFENDKENGLAEKHFFNGNIEYFTYKEGQKNGFAKLIQKDGKTLLYRYLEGKKFKIDEIH